MYIDFNNMQNYLIITIAAQHIYRILHGKCGRTVLMHKSVKYQKSNEWAQRTSEISDTNQRVWNTVRIHFSWCIMFIICILRIKFLFNDKLCCTDSSKKLIKDVSYKLTNVLTEDIQTVYHWRYSPQGSYFPSNTSQYFKQDISSLRDHNLPHLYI